MPTATSNHDLAPLRINARTWWKLEKRLGVSLGKWEREEIITATNEFAVAQHFRIVDKARHKLSGSRSDPTKISQLRTNLVRVQELWGAIQNDLTAQQFLEDVSNELGLGDVDDAMWKLRHLDYHLDAHLNPPMYDPFSHYIKEISRVYEKVTGKPVTITVPSGAYENQKTSTFVEIVKILDTILPNYAQQSMIRRSNGKRSKRKRSKRKRPTIAAWAKALIRARE